MILWLRCRILLAEMYKESGRRAEAAALAREVQGWLATADPGHPLQARIERLLRQH